MKLPHVPKLSLRKFFSFLFILSLLLGTIYFGRSQIRAVSPSLTLTPSSNTPSGVSNYAVSFQATTNIPEMSYLMVGIDLAGFMTDTAQPNFSSSSLSSFAYGELDSNNPEPIRAGIIITSAIPSGTTVSFTLNNVLNPGTTGFYTPRLDINKDGQMLMEITGASFLIGTPGVYGKLVTPIGDSVAWNGLALNNETGWHETSTSTDGSFAFFNLPSGTYNLQVFVQPGSDYISPTLDPVAYSGTPINLGNVSLVSPSKTVSGKVLYPDGSPVTDAEVNANRRGEPGWYNSQTDSQGRYSLGLPGGEFELMVNPAWTEQGQAQVDWAYTERPKMIAFAKDNTVETKSGLNFSVIEASATVQGKVVDPNGQVVNQGGVDVRNNTGQGSSGGLNQNGSFSIRVPAGKYNVSVFVNNNELVAPAMDSFSIGEEEVKNLGTIKLIQKNSHIKGKVTDEDGVGIEGVFVNAWQPMGSGWGNAQTDSAGRYDLLVATGNWELDAMPEPDAGYAMAGGPPTQVSISAEETITGVNFSLITANASITGTVVDGNGSILSGLYGFAEARPGGNMPMPGMGGPIENGQFTINVPAGTYEVDAMFEPGSDFTSTGGKEVTVAEDQTKTVTIVAKENDAFITGYIYNENGEKITGEQAEIFSFNNENAMKMTFVDPDTGAYRLGVLGGSTWFLGVFIDSSSGYVMVPPDNNSLEISSGETVERDFVLLTADATISGVVLDPDGDPLPNVFVFIDSDAVKDGNVLGASTVRQIENVGSQGGVLGISTEPVGGPGMGLGEKCPGFHFGDITFADGTFSISVPAGTYGVGSGAPPSLGYISPEIQEVTVASENTIANLELQYKESDAQIAGTIYLNGTASPGFIWGWSESGGFSDSFTTNGEFTLNVTQGDVWHLGADFESGQTFYQSSEYIVVVNNATENQDLILQEASFEMPPSVSRSFTATNPVVISLENGMTITVPAGAIATEGTITITVTPTARLAKQQNKKPVAFGYEIKAYNSSGQEITTTFNSNVTIVIPYTDEMLANLGITEDDLAGGYWDETSNLWQGINSVIVDKENNKITLTVDHFTSFAMVTGAADSIPPAAPTLVTVTDAESGGVLNLSWTNPTDSDFTAVLIYRSETEGVLGNLVATVEDATNYVDSGLTNGTTYYYILHSVDTIGNESYNTDQYSGVPTQAASELPETGMANITLNLWLSRVLEFFSLIF